MCCLTFTIEQNTDQSSTRSPLMPWPKHSSDPFRTRLDSRAIWCLPLQCTLRELRCERMRRREQGRTSRATGWVIEEFQVLSLVSYVRRIKSWVVLVVAERDHGRRRVILI
jgi:hypothetical protein